MTSVLRVDASMRLEGSTSRRLTGEIIDHLTSLGDVSVIHRDLADGVPFVDGPWIEANFTDPAERTDAQRAVLTQSDGLLKEVEDADILVIGAPIYNFGLPAALKAWIDMIVRARQAFRYTADGPEGLLKGKKAFIAVASGGTEMGSDLDFATGYLKHVLGFIGITDVTFIPSDRLGSKGEAGLQAVRKVIADLQV